MILIVSNTDDEHADAVESLLVSSGHRVERVSYANFPESACATVRIDGDRCRAHWTDAGEPAVDLASASSIWFRRPGQPASTSRTPGAAAFAESESLAFLDDVFDQLDVFMMPGPRPVVQRAQKKICQLRIAERLGLELPPTLVTNDPDEALAFHAACGGRVISKQIGFTDFARPDGVASSHLNTYSRYTERVTRSDLAHIDALRGCPMILQAEVRKRVELRVTVVGRKVFAVAIHSQSNARTALDWRHYDLDRTLHTIAELPDEVAARCTALTDALGLCYGAIDLIVTPDDRYVFVEINPSGQYLWLEDLTGLPISAAIADLLAAPPARGSTLHDESHNLRHSRKEGIR